MTNGPIWKSHVVSSDAILTTTILSGKNSVGRLPLRREEDSYKKAAKPKKAAPTALRPAPETLRRSAASPLDFVVAAAEAEDAAWDAEEDAEASTLEAFALPLDEAALADELRLLSAEEAEATAEEEDSEEEDSEEDDAAAPVALAELLPEVALALPDAVLEQPADSGYLRWERKKTYQERRSTDRIADTVREFEGGLLITGVASLENTAGDAVDERVRLADAY
ncbi:hypothetical protein HRR75_004114 [Exophiala dermatitidis]|nr:hypothetical protein HRR75_004114 [Exophiala dermatitidis]